MSLWQGGEGGGFTGGCPLVGALALVVVVLLPPLLLLLLLLLVRCLLTLISPIQPAASARTLLGRSSPTHDGPTAAGGS